MASSGVPPAGVIVPPVKSVGRHVTKIPAKTEAHRISAGAARRVTARGHVAAAAGATHTIARKAEHIPPPTSQGALPGITRQVVLDIAKDTGIPCRQSVVTLFDVYNADETFLTGTAAEVIAMVSCDGRTIGNGRPGRMTACIIDSFREAT